VQTKSDPYSINAALMSQHILGGYPVLNKFYPELGNAALWCCTEMVSRAAIDAAAEAMAQ
jgi:glycine dehydrogenase subunit 1